MLRRRGEDGHGYDDILPDQPVDEVIAAPSWQTVAESGPEPWRLAHDPGPDAYHPGAAAHGAEPDTEQWMPLFDAPPAVDDAGPATEQWRPVFDAPPAVDDAGPAVDDAGPATEQWRPVFDDGGTPEPPAGTPEPPGRHRSP
jgi:hypothetical protein